jgi:small subunit ribosomal protein S4
MTEKNVIVPKWLDVNADKMDARIVELPNREDIDLDVEEHYIVEYYSR